MNNKVTMQMIADKLGISKVSVSKAFKKDSGVSNKLRAKILETAAHMGYVARGVNGVKESFTFAYFVPKRFFLESDKFYNVIYYYLNRECVARKYQTYLNVLNIREEENVILPEMLGNTKLDGIFLLGEINDSYVKALEQLYIPIISIDFYKSFLQTDYVLSDNFFMGYSATMYLIDKGHRAIGFVGNIKQTSSIQDRYYGYLKALSSRNLQINPDYLISNNDPLTGVYFMNVKFPDVFPTAFVCHCDLAAFFLIHSLEKCGKSVPDDVSLISFDNTELSSNITPALTTYDIDKKQFALLAIEKMLARINHINSPYTKSYVASRLIERDSVKDIRS
jgi:LacI family transcriptional regulator